jgi:endonuclease YncB( thermonuclease family)
VEVTRAIDGDTLERRTGEMVRLIGVDTSETKEPRKPGPSFGREATAFTQRTVAGEGVRPESDQQRHDQEGRTLASVYLDKGTGVHAELIRQGYGGRTPGAHSNTWSHSGSGSGRCGRRDGGGGEPNDVDGRG